MNRIERASKALDWCVQKGIIVSWERQSQMPDRKRWTLEGIGFHTRVFTTKEVEIFLLGASEGRTSAILDVATTEASRTL